MDEIGFHIYKDRWVFASAEQVEGGQTLDAPPVRIIEQGDRQQLMSVIQELLSEKVPVVPAPTYDDYNDRRFTVGILAESVGLQSWPAFARYARCFDLRRHNDGSFLLEEWTREGASFSAKPKWRKRFPPGDLASLVDFLVRRTKPPKPPKPIARKVTRGRPGR